MHTPSYGVNMWLTSHTCLSKADKVLRAVQLDGSYTEEGCGASLSMNSRFWSI